MAWTLPAAALQVAALILVPPLLAGLINRTKALCAGRRGPSLWQPYRDLARLMRKGMVFSTTTTWIFAGAPVVASLAALAAGLLMPLGSWPAPLAFAGDALVFAALWGLARFFLAAAALDTGSPFEGMGSAREVSFACLTDPALFLVLMVLVRLAGETSLTAMLQGLAHGPWPRPVAPLVLASVGLLGVLLAEAGRIPVDDPDTHLELTMIHEAMILDHSGPLLGLISYGAAVKFYVLAVLLLHFLLPVPLGAEGFEPGALALDMGARLAGVAALAVLVGLIESSMARLPMRNVPRLLVAALLLCAFGFILTLE